MSKKKIELEFEIKGSSKILYKRISTPSGLSDWFADNVNVNGDIFTFIWDRSEEKAKLLKMKKDEFVRFKWLEDEDDDSYFELEIKIDPMTKDVALIITDFVEEDEEEEVSMLWENQIAELKHVLGS